MTDGPVRQSRACREARTVHRPRKPRTSRAAEQLLERHPQVDTRDLEDDNQRRTEVRNFLSSCIELLRQELREAVRLVRHVDDLVLRQEVLAAGDALTGQGTPERRQGDWRRAADAPGSPAARARPATAWAEWAAGTDVPEFAAEAYERLVTLAARDAVARPGAEPRDRALLAAQEYAEEAGYWLARAGPVREAVLALETGDPLRPQRPDPGPVPRHRRAAAEQRADSPGRRRTGRRPWRPPGARSAVGPAADRFRRRDRHRLGGGRSGRHIPDDRFLPLLVHRGPWPWTGPGAGCARRPEPISPP